MSPDRPVYKRLVLQCVAFHVLFCREGRAQDEEEMLGLISRALEEIRLGGEPVYSPKDAFTMLNDLVLSSGFIRHTASDEYEFESVPWLQYFALDGIGIVFKDARGRHDEFTHLLGRGAQRDSLSVNNFAHFARSPYPAYISFCALEVKTPTEIPQGLFLQFRKLYGSQDE